MNGQTTTPRSQSGWFLPGLILCLISGFAFGQVPVDEDGNSLAYSEEDASPEKVAAPSDATLTSGDLQDLVGPIALYPDDLLAIVLPASTYPLEIVQAARFLELLETDSSLEPDDDWDESVVALLNYPDVIKMMNDDIDWTWRLGDAVISQQAEVIAAVEMFRDRAYAAGNLKSDDNQTVSVDEGVIEIVPVNEEIIYVPYYEPAEVVVYQPRPVYHYYPNPYPIYYYPYPAGYHFRSGYFWGVTTAFSIGWSNHYLNVYHPTYLGHPYYGRSYYSHYYRRPSISVYNTWYVNNNRYSSSNRYRDGDYWRPRNRAGARPAEPRVRNYHYPPGGDQRRRENTVGRSRLDTRDNGRMDLNLRQRNDADRSRIAARSTVSTNRQDRVAASSQNNGRTALSSRGSNETGTRSTSRNRSSGNSGAEAGANSRNRVTSNSAQRSQRRSQADTDTAIQFRDRSAETRTLDSRTPNRQTAGGTSRRQANANSSGSRQVNRRSPQDQVQTATRQRQTATRTTANRTAAVNSRTPTDRRSAVRSPQPGAAASQVQRRTTTTRSTAPRTAAPQVQRRNTTARSVAPRSQATTRSSAPRTSAPARSAPTRSAAPTRRAAPRAPAPSSSGAASSNNRGSSSAPRNSSRASQSRRGASRPRNGN